MRRNGPCARAIKSILLLLSVFFFAKPASAEWLRVESANFIVYGEFSQRDMERRVALLEDYDQLLRQMTGTRTQPSANKLSIYLVRSGAQLRVIRRAGPNVMGFYSATPFGIAAVVDTSIGIDQISSEILLHEYAHHFMMQYFPANYPGWYVEGFAEYFQTARLAENQLEVGRSSPMRGYVLMQPGFDIDVERLMFPGGRRYDSNSFYAMSWLAVHYLMRSPTRLPQLRAYLTATARGADPRTAFREHFGVEPEAMNRELRTYLRGHVMFSRWQRPSAATAPRMTVTRLEAPDAIVLARASMQIGRREDGAALLERVRRAAAGRTDSLTVRTLAEAELHFGEPARAESLLTTQLQATPGDVELLYLRGMVEWRRAEQEGAAGTAARRAARNWFGRAHQIDANHFQTLYRYGEILLGEEDRPSENTVNILLLAHQLAPQVDEMSINAALALMGREDWQGAEALLVPLTANAHDNPYARPAGMLLTAVRERRQPNEDDLRRAEDEARSADPTAPPTNPPPTAPAPAPPPRPPASGPLPSPAASR